MPKMIHARVWVLLQESSIKQAASQHLSILTYLHFYSLHFYYKNICWLKQRFMWGCKHRHGMHTCILQEAFTQSILMNAVIPKPNPQAALMTFTLTNPFYGHHKSNRKGHAKQIMHTHAWGSRSCSSWTYKDKVLLDQKNTPAAAARGCFSKQT